MAITLQRLSHRQTGNSDCVWATAVLQRSTLTCGREERVSTCVGWLLRATTVHNKGEIALVVPLK